MIEDQLSIDIRANYIRRGNILRECPHHELSAPYISFLIEFNDLTFDLEGQTEVTC